MKKGIILIASLAITWSVSSQSFKKYSIANTGCAAYLFCDPGTFSHEMSPDSSDVYSAQCNMDSVSYNVILIKLKSAIGEISTAENVLISYLDYLKGSLNITNSAGYGKGHRLNNDENVHGVIDYWADKDGNQMKIEGWTNGSYISVLTYSSKAEVNETKANLFLNGLRFP